MRPDENRERPYKIVDGSPRLVGARCRDCTAVMFPARLRCPTCASAAVEELLLPRRGTLWTWTVQGFAPKSPPFIADEPESEFAPFGVGYVELDGYLRVESRLTVGDPGQLRIGMPMALAVLAHRGRAFYAFAPAAEETVHDEP